MGTYYRLYKGKEDYIKICSFLEESVSVSGPKFYSGLGDLDFCVVQCSSPNYLENIDEIFKDTYLWFDDNDQMIGGIWPDGHMIDFFIHPNKKSIFGEMVEVGEDYVKASISEKNQYEEIEWWVFEGDTELENVLISEGYYKTQFYRPHRIFDYSSEIEEPVLPRGYTIKKLMEVDDKRVILECCKNYFGIDMKEYMLENFKQTSTYREDLDLVVVAPENTLAAFCTVRYDEKNKMGTFEPVACHPEHKQKGITKALMCEGLKRVKALGAEVVTVQTSWPGRNLPANKLYESVGFKLIGNLYFWRKKC